MTFNIVSVFIKKPKRNFKILGSKVKMKYRKLCEIFFFITCISGFLFQLHQVSWVYFRYQTTSKILIHVKEIDDFPSVFFCPAYYYLLNRSDYKNYNISSEIPNNPLTELSTLTVKQILELTPKTSSIMKSCAIRDDNTSTVAQQNPSECHNFFVIKKFVNGERICYRIGPRNVTKYSVGNAASSLTHVTSVFTITFNPFFGRTKFGFIISYSSDYKLDPLYSRMFAAKFKNQRTINESTFCVYGEANEITKLPDPYDTQCMPGHKRQECYESCLIDRFSSINRMSWSGFHSKPLHIPLFTPLDYNNKTMARVARKSFHQCHQKCKIRAECITRFTVTTIYMYSSLDFVIDAMIPSRPFTEIAAIPLLTLVEYIIQVGSCFGVWFGLSVVSFNPTKWLLGNRKQIVVVQKIQKITVRGRLPSVVDT